MSEKSEKEVNLDKLAVENIMRTEDGRRYMYEKLQEMLVFEDTFDHDSINHAFKAGIRFAGLLVDKDLKEYTFDFYIKMLKENQ